jgi:hypothetical protein
MVQRDEVPEEVVDIEKWIQEQYTLESAAYTDNLPQGGEHLKNRGYGLQPDGDLVGDMATGEVFNTTVDLAQDEEFALIARGKTGNSTVDATIRMTEDY